MIRKVFLMLLALVLAVSVGLVACSGAPVEEEEEEEEEEGSEFMIYTLESVIYCRQCMAFLDRPQRTPL